MTLPGIVVPSPLCELVDERLGSVRLLLKRDDLIHPGMPGNKWRKLKYNLEAAHVQGSRTLLTFGGAYSNHIRAVAAAGELFGLSTIGVIRGEEHYPLNPSLEYAVSKGMRLSYMDRETYRRKTNQAVLDGLKTQFGDFYIIPEGGSNTPGVQGAAEIPAEIEEKFDVICCGCGTGGTSAGIASAIGDGQRAIGFSAHKGGEFLNQDVEALQCNAFCAGKGNWSIESRFHFGGYARRTAELDDFIISCRTALAGVRSWC